MFALAPAAADQVKQGTDAAKEIVPLANQYPLAMALVIVAAFAILIVWWQRKDRDQLARSLDRMVVVNDAQAKTLVELGTQMREIAVQLQHLPAIRTFLAGIATASSMKAFWEAVTATAASDAKGDKR